MFPNVCNQYHWNAVADRVINPKGSLLPLNHYLKTFLEPPEDVYNQAKPHLEKLHKLFGTINTVKATKKAKKSAVVTSKVQKAADRVTTNKNEKVPEVQKDEEEAIFIPDDLDFSMGEVHKKNYIFLYTVYI